MILPRVFISYSNKDRVLLALIAHRFSDLTLLYDRGSIKGGERIDEKIEGLVNQADCVLFLLTANSIKSVTIGVELEQIRRANKPIVILTDKLRELPHTLRWLDGRLQVSIQELGPEGALESVRSAVLHATQGVKSRPNESNIEQPAPRSLVGGTSTVSVPEYQLSDLPRSNLGRELLEQVIAMCAVCRVEVPAPDRTTEVPLFLCPNTFVPDAWTRALIQALAQQGKLVSGKNIAEIGAGTGVIPIALSRANLVAESYIGTDIDPLAARVSKLNIALAGLPAERFDVRGGYDVFEPLNPSSGSLLGPFDLVVANVPQVPTLTTGTVKDAFDYYPMKLVDTVDEIWARRGLALLLRILVQARSRLRPSGCVVAAVAGRPSLRAVEDLFRESGYEMRVLRRERIRQDPETDISAFVHFERIDQNICFEFYASAAGGQKINAEAAYRRLLAGQACFHEMFVVLGSIPTSSATKTRSQRQSSGI